MEHSVAPSVWHYEGILMCGTVCLFSLPRYMQQNVCAGNLGDKKVRMPGMFLCFVIKDGERRDYFLVCCCKFLNIRV